MLGRVFSSFNSISSIADGLRTAITPAFDFLFPPTCHICGSRIQSPGRYVCATCLSRLPRTHYHRMEMNRMEQRFAGKFPFEHATGYFFYSHDTDIASLIHDFKYRHFQGLAFTLGQTMANELLLTPFFGDADAIIPVPMHILKKARRGYNQTEELARGLSSILNIPVLDNLKASKPHRSQTRLTHEMRLKNLSDIFIVESPDELVNRHMILLDDVCTTGSTLTSCADTLLAAVPTLRLTLLTLAVTP